jgi:hypothetical protein
VLEVEAFPTATHKGPVLLPSRIGHLACGPSAEGPDPVGAAYNLGGSDDVVKIGDKNVFPMACVRAVTSDDRTAGEWLSVVERRTAGLDVGCPWPRGPPHPYKVPKGSAGSSARGAALEGAITG